MKHSKSGLEYLAEQYPGCPLYPEEKLVDYAMGRLSALESHHLERHLATCARCAGTVVEWQNLLGAEAGAITHDMPLGTAATSQEGVMVRDGDEHAVYDDIPSVAEWNLTSDAYPGVTAAHEPSARLRSKLMRAAYKRAIVRRIKSRPWPFIASQALAGALLVMLVIGLFSFKNDLGQQEATFEHTVNQRIAHMQSEDTERYVIQPVGPFYGSGSVWLKRASGEMLIVVKGLHSLEEKDYQVWLQNGNQLSSAGFMLVPGPQGRSYYYGVVTGDAERIVVSMEPKGGSLRPTGPEAVLVEMRR